LDFRVIIESAALPENFCRDTYVEYMLMGEDGRYSTYKTVVVKGINQKPQYNYDYHHVYSNVTDSIIN